MAASVLYVDDDRSLCQIVSKALAGEGYRVRLCHDGTDALAVLDEAVPDLLMIDVMLPRKDGFQVLEALRARGGELVGLPVLMLSGASPTPANRARASELGAAELLSKPVPLDRLLDVVRDTLAGSKQPAPARSEKSPSAKRRGSSGTLERVSFPALLHHLHGLRATGTLHLATAKKRKWVQLRDGYPIAVRSNLVRETLGRHLLRTRRISKELLEASRAEAEKRGVRQGEVLVAMDALSDEDVARALREQADEKFFEIFSWTKGSFRFERDGRLQRANALGLGRSPANLILEGVRTRFPIERVDAYLESHARGFVAHGESPFYRFQDVHVAPENERLLREIDGTQPLGDFRRVDELLRRTVYALLASGLLELQAKPATPKPRPPRKPAAKPVVQKPSKAHVAEERVAEPKHRDTRREDPRQAELMALADQIRADDPRAVLGVGEGASDAEVREAYERLSARAHPDRYKDGSQSLRALAEDVFARVRRAYEALTDPRAKKLAELANKQLEREERERQRAERAFQAEVETRQGEEAMKSRSYEAALAHFGKALELFPDEGDHHAYYGYALHLCHPGDPGMVAEAMEHVKRGLKLASHREKPYLFLGRLHKAVGQADQAERMFMRAVQIEPECLEAIRELRLIQMRREKSKGLIGRLFRK